MAEARPTGERGVSELKPDAELEGELEKFRWRRGPEQGRAPRALLRILAWAPWAASARVRGVESAGVLAFAALCMRVNLLCTPP